MTDVSARDVPGTACYRLRWPDHEVPAEEPTWLHYEVDTIADNVLRTVYVFADGRIERNSIALEERKGDECPSLLEEPFTAIMNQVPLDLIPAAAFEALWHRGIDTPFWFPDSFPRTADRL